MNPSRFVLPLICLAALPLTSCGSQSAQNDGPTKGNRQGEDQTQNDPPSGATVDTPAPEDPLDALGHQFLAAIQENDLDKYQACWLRIQDVEALIKNPPPGIPVPSDEEFNQMREYLSKRDEVIQLTFPILRRALIDKFSDLTTLTLSDVIAHAVTVRNGQKKANGFDVVLSTSEGHEVTYRIDDGAFLNERWYFSDKPELMFTITTEDGDTEFVSLDEYASEEELARLNDLDGP